MSIHKTPLLFSAILAVGFAAYAAGEKTPDFKANCPISNKPALQDKTADYKGAKVYFCCGNCPGAFTKDPTKFATKANHQLAATGQFTQTKCPFSGGKLNPDASVDVAGVKVGFCCKECKGKAEAAKGDAQIELCFKDDAFAKGFEIKKAVK